MNDPVAIADHGRTVDIAGIVDYPAGSHPGSPIDDRLRARRYMTGCGSFWTALDDQGEPTDPPAFVARSRIASSRWGYA